jgi:hypothetical protein
MAPPYPLDTAITLPSSGSRIRLRAQPQPVQLAVHGAFSWLFVEMVFINSFPVTSESTVMIRRCLLEGATRVPQVRARMINEQEYINLLAPLVCSCDAF